MEQKETLPRLPDIVLFGAPGAGKGTQGEHLIEKFGYQKFEMGSMVRSAIKKETKVGKEAEKYLSKGLLVPDPLVEQILQEEAGDFFGEAPLLFDGFPRTESQREMLENLMKSQGRNFEVIALTAKDKEDEEGLVLRIVERAKASGRTDDQNPETIRRRMEEFREKTLVLLENWKKDEKEIHEISAFGDILEISENIQELVRSFSQKVEKVIEDGKE
ncbi:nucleoside monophosphate kinase [Candidatus Gracilibacteria bacterium]|nr:nucleoside monophosphate kinase [Candidatus Gracilibacteria bacterium]MCF7819124.1 nucleoside monophosphate kinase [Candidatus Gracilibacteria bacterium]